MSQRRWDIGAGLMNEAVDAALEKDRCLVLFGADLFGDRSCINASSTRGISMSRPLRIELTGGLYHVTSRGNRREAIYLDSGCTTVPCAARSGRSKALGPTAADALMQDLSPSCSHRNGENRNQAGAAPRRQVRCSTRGKRAASKLALARCSRQRLSHISRSPAVHLWR